jgi:hypothetical protein
MVLLQFSMQVVVAVVAEIQDQESLLQQMVVAVLVVEQQLFQLMVKQTQAVVAVVDLALGETTQVLLVDQEL